MQGSSPLIFTPSVARHLSQGNLEVVVTGGGGWLGRTTLEMLEGCLGDAFTTRVHVFGSNARELTLRSGRSISCRALADLAALTARPVLLAHYAFLTRDRLADLSAQEFVARNEAISSFVAAQARRLGAHRLFLPSSGAVYGKDGNTETDFESNPYGALKARDEARFGTLAEDGAPRTVTIRVFNLAGPFINKHSSYALSSILLDILAARTIVLRADRAVLRSYVHVRDVVDLAFALMTRADPPPPEPFDTAGEVVVEVGELAERAARLLGHTELAIERPALTSREPDRYVGNGTTMSALSATAGLTMTGLDDQILDTARYLAEP